MSDAATGSNCRKRTISRFTARGNERGIDPVWVKFARLVQHFVATTVDCCIRAETFDKAYSVFTRSHCKHASSQALRKLDGKMSNPAAGAVDHHRLVRLQSEHVF